MLVTLHLTLIAELLARLTSQTAKDEADAGSSGECPVTERHTHVRWALTCAVAGGRGLGVLAGLCGALPRQSQQSSERCGESHDSDRRPGRQRAEGALLAAPGGQGRPGPLPRRRLRRSRGAAGPGRRRGPARLYLSVAFAPFSDSARRAGTCRRWPCQLLPFPALPALPRF